MIALEVRLNGKRVCVAGAEDLSVLSAIVTASGPLGKRTVPVRPDEVSQIVYQVGGLTSRSDPAKDVHLRWKGIKGYITLEEYVEALRECNRKYPLI